MERLDRRKLIRLAAIAIGISSLEQPWIDVLMAEDQPAPAGFIKMSENLLGETHLDPILSLAYWKLLKQKFKLDEGTFFDVGKGSSLSHPDKSEIETCVLKMWLCASNDLPTHLKARGYTQALVWKLIGITPPSIPYGLGYDLPGDQP